MSCSRNKNNNGRNMHSWMKLRPYKLKIHPNSWHKANMVSNFFDCMQGIQQHACHCAHTCNPTHSTHLPRQRQKQVQLKLNMYFDKLMCMTTSKKLKIRTDTMHQCVSGSTTPKKTMHILANKLDEGAEPMQRLQQRKEFTSTRCHHEVHAHHHR